MIEKTISHQDLNPPAIVRGKEISLEDIVSALIVNREAVDDIRYTRGEWAVYAEQKHGKDALKYLAIESGIRKKDLQEARNVVLAFPKSVREEFKKLSYKHLRLIQQKFPDGKTQMKWIKNAHDSNWTTGNLTKEFNKLEPKKGIDIEQEKTKMFNIAMKVKEQGTPEQFDDLKEWIKSGLKRP